MSVKKGQIAHIDHDNTNAKPENLAFLCFDHHDEYDSQTRQSKGITSGEVVKSKAALHYAMKRKGETFYTIEFRIDISKEDASATKSKLFSAIQKSTCDQQSQAIREPSENHIEIESNLENAISILRNIQDEIANGDVTTIDYLNPVIRKSHVAPYRSSNWNQYINSYFSDSQIQEVFDSRDSAFHCDYQGNPTTETDSDFSILCKWYGRGIQRHVRLLVISRDRKGTDCITAQYIIFSSDVGLNENHSPIQILSKFAEKYGLPIEHLDKAVYGSKTIFPENKVMLNNVDIQSLVKKEINSANVPFEYHAKFFTNILGVTYFYFFISISVVRYAKYLKSKGIPVPSTLRKKMKNDTRFRGEI